MKSRTAFRLFTFIPAFQRGTKLSLERLDELIC
jgi:hypothetical protein